MSEGKQVIIECTGVVCDECPYRKKSTPGWLGPYDVTEYVDPIGNETLVPCHKTFGLDRRPLCSGLVATRLNSHKLMIDPVNRSSQNKMRTNDAERAKVFSFKHEFIEHHSNQTSHEGRNK